MTATTVIPKQSSSLTLPVDTAVGSYFISNYPPFASWSPGDLKNLLRALTSAPNAVSPIGLYVHTPFCRHRCHHCNVQVYPNCSVDEVDRYLQHLIDECSGYLRYPALQNRPFNTVHLGGGSPSYLSPDQLLKLIQQLRGVSDWSRVEEFTVECEPGSLSPEKLHLLKTSGATRLSIGFQTLNDEILQRLGNGLTVDHCLAAYEDARAAGFDEINIGLVAGLAGETEDTWIDTVEQVLDLAPDCITINQLELAAHSSGYAEEPDGSPAQLPSWPMKRDWVKRAFQLCEEAGYVIASGYTAVRQPEWWRFVYTVDHFWHGADLLGIGASAFGYLQGVHYQNVNDLQQYCDMISRRAFPWLQAHELTAEEKLHREFILHLKTGIVDLSYFRQKFGVNLLKKFHAQIELLGNERLLEIESGQIQLTRNGLLKLDWLLPLFYLPQHQATGPQANTTVQI